MSNETEICERLDRIVSLLEAAALARVEMSKPRDVAPAYDATTMTTSEAMARLGMPNKYAFWRLMRRLKKKPAVKGRWTRRTLEEAERNLDRLADRAEIRRRLATR